MCVPESFCTHRNASSVEFLETGLIWGSEIILADIRGSVCVCYCGLQSCCDRKFTLYYMLKLKYCVVWGYKMLLQDGYWRAGEKLWSLYQWL